MREGVGQREGVASQAPEEKSRIDMKTLRGRVGERPVVCCERQGSRVRARMAVEGRAWESRIQLLVPIWRFTASAQTRSEEGMTKRSLLEDRTHLFDLDQMIIVQLGQDVLDALCNYERHAPRHFGQPTARPARVKEEMGERTDALLFGRELLEFLEDEKVVGLVQEFEHPRALVGGGNTLLGLGERERTGTSGLDSTRCYERAKENYHGS